MNNKEKSDSLQPEDIRFDGMPLSAEALDHEPTKRLHLLL